MCCDVEKGRLRPNRKKEKIIIKKRKRKRRRRRDGGVVPLRGLRGVRLLFLLRRSSSSKTALGYDRSTKLTFQCCWLRSGSLARGGLPSEN